MKKLLLLLLASVPVLVSAQVTTYTAVFPFDSVRNNTGRIDPTPVPVVTGLEFDSVRSVGASANSSAGFRFSFSNWPTGATNGNGTYAGLTGTLDPAKYYEFEITPDLGLIDAYSIDSISFRFQRSGTGVRTYVVRGSEDAFATNLSAGVQPANVKIEVQTGNVFYFNVDSTGAQDGSKIYPGATYSNLTTPVQFRFYAYNAEATTGTFSIDNVTIYGTTTIITSVASYNENVIKIYPNPSSNGSITIASTSGEKNIEIYDLRGKLVDSKVSTGTTTTFETSSLNAGSYIVKVVTSSGTSIVKFVKN